MKQLPAAYIINVSSMASYFVVPNKNTYSATKIYLKQFSLSLRTELEGETVRVSVVCPSGILSNAYQFVLNHSSNLLARLSAMHPDQVASYTIDKALQGKAVIIPGRFNRYFWLLTRIIPGRIKLAMAKKTLKIPQTFIPLHLLGKTSR